MSSKVEKLSERVGELSRRLEADSRKGPPEWFGFHTPPHPYDPPNAKFDIDNRNAWRWFCYLQMTATELDEYVSIEVWNSDNHYPLATYGTPPELRKEAEAFDERRQELEKAAQALAEEVDRKDPDAYPQWREFCRELEKSIEDRGAGDEPTEPLDDSLGKGSRLLWDWQLKVLDLYRKAQAEKVKL